MDEEQGADCMDEVARERRRRTRGLRRLVIRSAPLAETWFTSEAGVLTHFQTIVKDELCPFDINPVH